MAMDFPGTWWKHRDGEPRFTPAHVGEVAYNEYQLARTKNLNNLEWADEHTPMPLVDLKPESFVNALVKPVFRDIEQQLVECIEQADVVVGCMAWLTNKRILKALSNKTKGVQIVVQQEDWLRPDTEDWTMRKQRELYRQLNGIPNSYAQVNWCAGIQIQPIRLSGTPKNSQRNNPKMHHKFLVFCRSSDSWVSEAESVWTGSFNATQNATCSLENGLLINSPEIANIYMQEWRQVLMTSTTIGLEDWDKEYGDDYLRDGS